MSTTTVTTKTVTNTEKVTPPAATADFDVEQFEQRLLNLKDSSDSIQQLSQWCLQQRSNHKKIVSSWLNVLKQVRVEHRLTLFYLANDVIQYSKRKQYAFVESWGTTLQKATTMVRDEKVRNKIFRIFKIWEQREIYSEEYLSDLNGLLSMNPVKKTAQQNVVDGDEYQNTALITNIRDCVKLEGHTDRTFKRLPKVPVCDVEAIKNNLKDRNHSDASSKEIDDYVVALESYIRSLKNELKCRKSLLSNIQEADTFYTNQRAEVKVVVNAYKSFGNRMKSVKRKLEIVTPNLPSPIPSPDINAPSPGQDDEIILPDENPNTGFGGSFTLNTSANGFSTYMDGTLPFDINDFKRESPIKAKTTKYDSNPIQVISSRSSMAEQSANLNFDFGDFYKPTPDNSSYDNTSHLAPPPPGGPVHNQTNYGAAPMQHTGPNPLFSQNPVAQNYGSHNDAYNPGGYSSDSSYTSDQIYDPAVPLMPPPPMPASLGTGGNSQAEDFNSTWDLDMSWNSNEGQSAFGHMLDTPVSPPHFEREGVDSDLVEYIEESSDDLMHSTRDIDHRQLHFPPIMNAGASLKEKKVDIDHRNLISLTGSPNNSRHSENKKKSHAWSGGDKDFRKFEPTFKPVTPTADEKLILSNDIDYRVPNLQEVPRAPVLESTTKTAAAAKLIKFANDTTSEKQGTSLPPPPLLPPPGLETTIFPQLKEILATATKSFDTSMPPPPAPPKVLEDTLKDGRLEEREKEKSRDNNEKVVAKAPNDNTESIDMEMSDEDLEELFGEIEQEAAAQRKHDLENEEGTEYTPEDEKQQEEQVTEHDYNHPDESNSSIEQQLENLHSSFASEQPQEEQYENEIYAQEYDDEAQNEEHDQQMSFRPQIPPPNYRRTLLETPDFPPYPPLPPQQPPTWENGNFKQFGPTNDQMNNGSQNYPPWHTPRPPAMPPQFHMPPSGGHNQNNPFLRPQQFISPQRNFSSPHQNFRSPNFRMRGNVHSGGGASAGGVGSPFFYKRGGGGRGGGHGRGNFRNNWT